MQAGHREACEGLGSVAVACGVTTTTVVVVNRASAVRAAGRRRPRRRPRRRSSWRLVASLRFARQGFFLHGKIAVIVVFGRISEHILSKRGDSDTHTGGTIVDKPIDMTRARSPAGDRKPRGRMRMLGRSAPCTTRQCPARCDRIGCARTCRTPCTAVANSFGGPRTRRVISSLGDRGWPWCPEVSERCPLVARAHRAPAGQQRVRPHALPAGAGDRPMPGASD